ncbi:hypothetical protein QIH85_23965 [Bradyrhizobium japonicum]|uniref:hypothetical protein n=1 Tax=Bradyrhizobium japonicum TaxID=375 RepID=UPI00271461F0|nr:hypothetical protein [Bradyrhizobium japonicum]WLB24940.1 hypothetical protein QIH85_23965 [Bradyrhizobium japonicum]
MTSIERPRRLFSFTDWSKANGTRSPPGDRLDAQIDLLVDAIFSTQQALAEIQRDDGKLKNSLVTAETLEPSLADQLAIAVERRTAAMVQVAEQAAARTRFAEQNLSLFARDAEAAAISASQFLSAVNTAQQLVAQSESRVANLATSIETDATDAENWGQYSKAQADNAIKAKDEALQWAEYLAGPVVNADDAPAYIAASPFPHGLYYQPVEGYGGVAGLWSAKWWAIYAAQLVGPWGYYYLGGWHDPPLPGETNPNTGIKVPNPIAPGSTYYDLDQNQLYVWNGSTWTTPLSLAPGFVQQLVYTAGAGQTVFSGPDDNSAVPNVGTSPSDVHINGVRQIPNDDFTVDAATNKLTLTDPVSAGSMVQWDILIPSDQLAPGAVLSFKIHTLTPDGSLRDFTLEYTDPSSGMPALANVSDAAQLTVVLDGITQEPGPDFTASGSNLHLVTAPRSDAHLWAVWHRPAGAL